MFFRNKSVNIYVIIVLFYFYRLYHSIKQETAQSVWHPKITFEKVLSVEKIQGFGYEKIHEYYIISPNKMEMDETFKITFTCNFEFEKFPFDKQECNFSLYDRIYNSDYVILTTTQVYYLSDR